MNKGYWGDLPAGLGCIGGEVDKEFERDSKRQGSHLTFVFVFVFVFVFEFVFVFAFALQQTRVEWDADQGALPCKQLCR